MSTNPLLPSYGAATQRARSNEYRFVGKHTCASRALMDTLCAPVFFISAIFATLWAANLFDTTPTSSAPLLPYFASLSLVISTCFWLGYLIAIAIDDDRGSVLRRRITISIAIVGKLVLAIAHMVMWQAYKTAYEGLWTPSWVIVFMAAQAWFDVLFVGVNGWVL